MAQQYRGVDFTIPHIDELARQYDELGLFAPLGAKESAGYNTEIQNITAWAFGLAVDAQPAEKRIRAKAPARPGQPKPPKQQAEPKKSSGFGGLKFGNPFAGRKGEF